MESKIKDLLEGKLDELNLWFDSCSLDKEDNNLYLRICLDSNEIIDLNKIVLATKIIDPIITDANLVEGEYILDIYGKSKGSVENEKE